MPSVELPSHVRAQWPWAPRFTTVNGWRMHYIDEGAGDPVVLLHGNPTWGFLYRDFVQSLVRAGRRVVIPDMIGFGLSEKPTREHAHSLDGHAANPPLSPARSICGGSLSCATTGAVPSASAMRWVSRRPCAPSW
jgi:pimeloyl-ACP methyl ester carboxylesterase